MTPRERFEAKVQKTDGCWLWQGGLLPNGYGSFWLDGRNRTAHHAAHLLYIGHVPDGLQVCHRCDVRACVRPDHLFLGTAKDNADDRDAKGRTYRTWSHQKLALALDLRAAGHTISAASAISGVPHATLERHL